MEKTRHTVGLPNNVTGHNEPFNSLNQKRERAEMMMMLERHQNLPTAAARQNKKPRHGPGRNSPQEGYNGRVPWQLPSVQTVPQFSSPVPVITSLVFVLDVRASREKTITSSGEVSDLLGGGGNGSTRFIDAVIEDMFG